MTYSDKLKDPRWQKRRLDALNRDEFKCRMCWSKTKTLHVHHLFYVKGREPWEYPLWSLVTRCKDCHDHEKCTDEDGEWCEEEWERVVGWAFDDNIESAEKDMFVISSNIQMAAVMPGRSYDSVIRELATFARTTLINGEQVVAE